LSSRVHRRRRSPPSFAVVARSPSSIFPPLAVRSPSFFQRRLPSPSDDVEKKTANDLDE